MAERPRGTVTFLFTDVEGSTRLLKLLRDRYGSVLGEHQRIVRDAFAAHGGEEVDTQGDSFFYVFSRARDAAEAAAAAQRGLAAHAWPEGAELRIRIGLHTGEPAVSGDGRYHGLGVHRTARIMDAAWGGQVLCSQATAAVLSDDEPPGLHLRDLGHHRLKDLDRPEHIFQLDVDGLRQRFPPLRTGMPKAGFWNRRRLVAAASAAVLAGGVALGLGLALSRSGHALSQVDVNALGFVDASSGRITAQVPVGATPTHVAVGEGAVWVTNSDGDSVSRIDPGTRAVVQTIGVDTGPSGIATGAGAVWVSSLDGVVSWIAPATSTVVRRIRVGNAPAGIAYGAGSVWVANTGDDTITRIDAQTGERRRTLKIDADELAFGAGSLWASQRSANRVVRIDPGARVVIQAFAVGNGPAGLAVGDGAVWVANSLDGTVSRIDLATNSVTTVSVGNGASAVAVNANGVWVSNQFAGTLARIDPQTNQVVRRVSVGNRPQGVALSGRSLLVSVRQSGAGHRGGTLRIRTNRTTSIIDPAIAYDSTSWAILKMTGDGLVAFNQSSGLAGAQLVPDLAVSLPAPTDGGRTYVFQLHPSIRYSDGRRLRASDFRRTFERDFEVGTPAAFYYDTITGARRCERIRKRCDLSRGIVADDRGGTVTFHLTAPDPEFLYKLALSFAFVVPPGSPSRKVDRPLPGTGPYRIATYRPKHVIRLVRNTEFREWSQAAQPDGYPDVILFQIGGSPDSAADAVARDRADLFTTSQSETLPSQTELAKLTTRYASRVHTNRQPATIGLFLNTRLAPFDRPDVRRALNYAADRAAAVRAAGGSAVADPTCQILPPGFPGYEPYCPWRRPNLAKAQALVDRSGTRGMKVTFWSWGNLGGIGPYAVKLLRSLGYRASTRVISGYRYFGVVGDSRTRAQIGTTEWISDYVTAAGFFNGILTCDSFLPANRDNSNDAEFCDPRIDRRIRLASGAQAVNADAARGLWERIDREATDEAPWVPLVNPRIVDVLSSRVGNYEYSYAGPGPLIDQLWVR